MSTPTEFAASQVIGTIESVSPREITVRLDVNAPQATALNAGHVQRFPRINGWVLVPSEVGYLIGAVTWIGIEQAPRPYGSGNDLSLIDLPFPARRMKVTPLGTLRWHESGDGLELIRGILSYPSVGEPALVPTPEQLRALAQATTANTHLRLGTSPLAGDVDVAVDPDRLFGRHLAVLGNTGSGKSCTVAGLVRWSLEAAQRSLPENRDHPNARFIILDPNGEYSRCFADLGTVRVFRPVPDESFGESQLTVPGWVWSCAEWSAISRAAMQTQRPLLQQALRNLRNGADADASAEQALAIELNGFANIWRGCLFDPSSYSTFPKYKNLTVIANGMLDMFRVRADQGLQEHVNVLVDVLKTVTTAHSGYDKPYTDAEVRAVAEALEAGLSGLAVPVRLSERTEDAPQTFNLDELPDHLVALSRVGDFASASAHAAFLIARIRTLLTDMRLRSIICPDTGQTFEKWLTDIIGSPTADNGQIAVLDLSLLAQEVLHTVVGVLGRVVMEALQYVRRLTGADFPTVLVLEEAHNFVGAAGPATEVPTTFDLCRGTFERIAREGRKFGLGLVIASQRPSALSATVLSQCNSFLLHRLVNDRDQDLIGRMVPDSLGDLLNELPSLPSRQAILLGWATPVPTLVEVAALPPEQRPRSSDPRYWDTWTWQREVEFAWSDVVSEWIDPGSGRRI